MIRVFLAEWRKLRRPTLFVGTMLAVVGFTSLVTSILFLMIDSEDGNSTRGQVVSRLALMMPSGITVGLSTSGGLLGLVALCVFASQTAQEYTYGTLRNLLVRQPRRLTLLAGKFLSMAAFALITVIFSTIVSISLAYALAGKAEVMTTAWSTSEARIGLIHTFVNVLISVISYGTIGMILGLLLRSPISAISIGLAWLLIVESIIAATVSKSAQWMPGQLMNSVAAGGDISSSYSHALLLLAGYLAIGVIVASVLFRQRDVSN